MAKKEDILDVAKKAAAKVAVTAAEAALEVAEAAVNKVVEAAEEKAAGNSARTAEHGTKSSGRSHKRNWTE